MPFENDRDTATEIWLIGGYGDVGKRLADVILRTTPLRVVLAGRDKAKADLAAADLGARARGERVAAAQGLPEEARHVVNFVETLPPSAAAGIVERGGLYIDASANPDYLAHLQAAIPAGPGLAVLNAGLTPGLTNVLARALKQDLPRTRRIDIVLEMGMGRHHGHAAVAWTLAGLSGTYRAKRQGHWRDVTPGRERRDVQFEAGSKAVPAIGFGFSDQAAIARSLDLDEARTFLAVAPASMTRSLGFAAGRGLGHWIARHADRLTRIMAALPPLGPIRTRLRVEALDRDGEMIGAHVLTSGDQSDITAVMLSLAVTNGLESTLQGGVGFDAVVTLEACKSALDAAVPGTTWSELE